MPRTPRLDDKTRALVPLLSVGLTSFFCCVDAYMRPESKDQAPPARTVPLPATPPAMPEVAPPPPAQEPATAAAQAPPIAIAGPPAILVELDKAGNGAALDVGIEGDYAIYAGVFDALEAHDQLKLATGGNLRFAHADAVGGRVRINGQALGQADVTLLPASERSVRVGARRYTGALVLRATGSTLRAVNLVSLEDYLQGVLFAEMPRKFHREALRAQAVISRTFALYQAMHGRELRDDQGSQMYLGLELADSEAARIVDSTFGEILAWEGQPLETYFCSCCGGRTAAASSVFDIAGSPPVNATTACDACSASPFYRWTRKVKRADLDRLYRGALGSGLRLEPGDVDRAGRALRFDVIDAKGKEVDRPSADRLRNDFNAGRPLDAQLLSTWIDDVHVDKTTLTLRGRGFGHGVGLCQYGAHALGTQGTPYRLILARYYPGAELTRLYD